MREYKIDNIWDYLGKVDGICFTSNGFVKPDGRAVMGRGIALETKEKFDGVDKLLGKHIMKNGNNVGIIRPVGPGIGKRTSLISFPVKREQWLVKYNTDAGDDDFPGFARRDLMEKFRGQSIYPGWALKAEIQIVRRSAEQLMALIEWKNWNSVLLTPPGCFNGGLPWEVVGPMLEKIVDHRVFIVYNKI